MTHFLQDLWSAMHSLMLPRDKKRSIKNLVKYLDDNVNAHHIRKFGEQIGYCTKRKPEHWYFVTKIVLTYCEKKIVLVMEKNCKIFDITRTIYSNSERSKKVLVTE